MLYATTEGQTARIAERIGERPRAAGHSVTTLLFVRVAGGDTDTSRNYEYTDWDAVAKFADAVDTQA